MISPWLIQSLSILVEFILHNIFTANWNDRLSLFLPQVKYHVVPTLADIGQLVWDGFDDEEGEIIYEEEEEEEEENEEETNEESKEGEKLEEASHNQHRKHSVLLFTFHLKSEPKGQTILSLNSL